MSDESDFGCDGCMHVWYVIGPRPEKCPRCGSREIHEIDFDDELETTGEENGSLR